jgi:hypothetical protein
MRWHTTFALCAAATALISGGISLIQAQVSPAQPSSARESPASGISSAAGRDLLIIESKGIPPRTAPSDYSSQARAGTITFAADFTGHTVGTQDGLLTTDEYVAVEVGVYGPPSARLMLSVENFSLRINGKRAMPADPYELVAKSLKDPNYEQPVTDKTGKTVLNGGGKQDGTDPGEPPPTPLPIPFEVKRGWGLRIKRDSLLIGDRALPQAGLLFFPHSGPDKGLRSVELIYSGPAGKATLSLHPY